MRFIVGGIVHETHTFSSELATYDDFHPARGDELMRWAGTNHSLGGTLDACQELGIDVAPTLFASATPSGPPSQATFESLLTELVNLISDALPAEGVVLNLHGAMVAEGYPDAEAEIAQRVRAAVGPNIPIAVTLDLHANIGQAMVDAVNIITTYDTYPHIDAGERGREAVELLHRTALGEIKPTIAMVKPPLMPVPQAQFTSAHPFSAIYALAFEMERHVKVLTVTVAPGFAYSDIPEAGASLIVITNDDLDLARALAMELAELTWSLRNHMLIENVDPAEAVRQAITTGEGPVILVDVADNIGGGTPGDGSVLLAELIRQDAQNAVIVISDPDAVQSALSIGIGGQFSDEVGAKLDRYHGNPCPITGEVIYLGNGKWVHEGPENAGVPVDMGPTAIVQVGGIKLVLTSIKCMPGDLQQLKSIGIDPTQLHIIVVKAAVRWRGGYEPIMAQAIHVDTPGLCTANLDLLDFKHVRRPLFPLDRNIEWL